MTDAAVWDPAAHPRAPAGGATGGQFAPGGTGAAPTNQNPVGEGASGQQVKDLQKRLNALGAKPPLAEDGKFGPKTLAAVRAFQAAHKDAHGKPLKVDGLVGPLTTSALRLKTPAKTGGTAKTGTGKTSTGKPASTKAPARTQPTKAQPAKPAKAQPAKPAKAQPAKAQPKTDARAKPSNLRLVAQHTTGNPHVPVTWLGKDNYLVGTGAGARTYVFTKNKTGGGYSWHQLAGPPTTTRGAYRADETRDPAGRWAGEHHLVDEALGTHAGVMSGDPGAHARITALRDRLRADPHAQLDGGDLDLIHQALGTHLATQRGPAASHIARLRDRITESRHPAAVTAAQTAAFDPLKHPRGYHGKFAPVAEGISKLAHVAPASARPHYLGAVAALREGNRGEAKRLLRQATANYRPGTLPAEQAAQLSRKIDALGPGTHRLAGVADEGGTGRPADWHQDYVPYRPGWTPDLTPATGVKSLTSHGRPDGAGTAADPIDVRGDLDKALTLMQQGKHVRLNQPDEVSVIMHKIAEISQATKDLPPGEKPPDWDLGLLTITGTNLFTAQNRGISRINMPQFSGLAVDGTPAGAKAGGGGRFADMSADFADKLRADGIKVTPRQVPAAHLRATQTELIGSKVAGFAAAVERGVPKAKEAIGERIYVTRDGYVIDGHHRWAANMMLDSLNGVFGDDILQNVNEVDMDIGAAIPYANAFARDIGIAPVAAVKKAAARLIAAARAGTVTPGDLELLGQLAGLRAFPRELRGEAAAYTARLDVAASAALLEDPQAARAPGHGGNAQTLRDYWTHGEGGTEKVRWGTGGDFDRCVREVGKYMADPKGYCAERHHDALGIWPATHAKEVRDGGAKAAGGDSEVRLPALVTIPGVDLLAAGTWHLSTGRQTFTGADLAAAVDAAKCPAVGSPVIKIGHLDDRFAPQAGQDGEPAIGRVTNMRVTGTGIKLKGDLAGMPGWLGAIAASAFPRRSVEGKFRFRCQIGHTHPFVVTALALLGVTPPGIGVLGGLQDIASLYGLDHQEEPAMPDDLGTAAAGWDEAKHQRKPRGPGGGEFGKGGGGKGKGPPQMRSKSTGGEPAGKGGTPPWLAKGTEDAAPEDKANAMSKNVFGHSFAGGPDSAEALDAHRETAKAHRTAARLSSSPATVAHHQKMAKLHAAVAGGRKFSRDAEKQSASALSGSWRTPPTESEETAIMPVSEEDVRRAYYATAGLPQSMWITELQMDPTQLIVADEDSGKLFRVPFTISGSAVDFGQAAEIAGLAGLAAARGTGPLIAYATAAESRSVIEPPDAAWDDDSEDDDVEAAGGSPAPAHSPFTGKHAHPHPAGGDQGDDETHEHTHSHDGDADHEHAHDTNAAADAAASTETGGDSDVEFTTEQWAAIRRRLGKGDSEPVTPAEIAAAIDTPRAPDVAAAGGQVTDDGQVAVPQIADGTYLVDAEILRGYQDRAVSGDRAVHAMHIGERDTILAAAVRAGKFAQSRTEYFARLWDKDPEGTRKLVASLASGLIPMAPAGSNGDFAGDPDMPGDFEAQKAYKDLYPEDYARERQAGGRR